MIEKLTRSLSFRLHAIILVLAAAFIYFATIGMRWVYREDDLRELISGHLSLHVNYVRNDIGDPPNIDRAIAITEQVPVDIRISGAGFEWASDPAFPEIDALQFGASDIFSEDPGALLNALQDVEFAVSGSHRFLKIDQGDYDIVVSSPRISDTDTGPALLPTILAIGLIWLFVAYVSVSWLFRPIRNIRRGAARIGQGDFEYRITGYRHDQLGDLAEDVNRLADDVKNMLDAKRQLLLGISHELRSPLSRLRLALEFIEDSDRKESVRAELAEIDQIISSLLEAERLNTRHAAINRSKVLVRELFEQLIETYFDDSEDRIKLRVEPDSLEVDLDHVRIALLLKNLIGNALRYSEAGETVSVAAVLENGTLRIVVEDRGPGFSADQVANFGEPFYRGDPSRTRDTGGYGLGIYLAKLVAEAHGGSLVIDESYTSGARLVATLPA